MKLSDAWDLQHPFLYLLTPFSGLFRAIVYLRRCCYRLGFKKIVKFPVPIIVVGNITVGGTGKTPLVAWLANYLRELGFKPGLVSRGYSAQTKQFPVFVDQDSDVKLVGDESYLLVKKTHCPMVIDPDRVNAVKNLLAKTDCNIIISDDGLQHYAMGRDVEIAVIDGVRRFGNRLCLPAGPLREPLTRLQEVNFVVTNGEAQKFEYEMTYEPCALQSLIDSAVTQPLSNLAGKTVHAVAGIGNPQRFFQQLRNAGLYVIEHVFPDHHAFTLQDINFDEAVVIMTEKDAVKCEVFADYRHWYLPVEVKIDPQFSVALHQLINAIGYPS